MEKMLFEMESQVMSTTPNIFLAVPTSRENRDKWPAAIVLTITTLIVLYIFILYIKEDRFFLDIMADVTQFDTDFCLMMLATIVFSQLLAEFLRRMCLFWEEYHHLETRYNNSKMKAIYKSLSMKKLPATIFACTAILCLIFICLYSSYYRLYCLIVIPLYCFGYLVLHSFGIMGPRESELCGFDDAHLNFGQAFAWQYYYGYLNIILPDFLIRVQDFERGKDVSIAVHKLFILMPLSCQLPQLLSGHQADHGYLEYYGDLKEVRRDRNGTRGRVYKNPVYRIKVDHNMEPLYCCMEGAAILTSLHDMCEGEKLTGLTDEMKLQHTLQFVSALKDILSKNADFGHLVELVFYKDWDDSGDQVRIRDVVTQRIGEVLVKRS